MKNLILSAVAIFAISTSAMAESYPANGPDSYKALHSAVDDENINSTDISRAYIGIAYSYINIDFPDLMVGENSFEADIHGNAITIFSGYEINQYFAVEGRYSKTVDDLSFDISGPNIDTGRKFGGDISNIALYLKPMYTSGSIGFYGLLGAGHITTEVDDAGESSDNTFQWGLGLSFDAGTSIIGSDASLFIDYVRLDEVEDATFNAFNFGLAFKF